jgi:hypothetical protein
MSRERNEVETFVEYLDVARADPNVGGPAPQDDHESEEDQALHDTDEGEDYSQEDYDSLPDVLEQEETEAQAVRDILQRAKFRRRGRTLRWSLIHPQGAHLMSWDSQEALALRLYYQFGDRWSRETQLDPEGNLLVEEGEGYELTARLYL